MFMFTNVAHRQKVRALAFTLLCAAAVASAPFAFKFLGSADRSLAEREIKSRNLTFSCRFSAPSGPTVGHVMLLHGFPEWSSMWQPLMKRLANKGYHSVACNQRGYSPGASPEFESDYNYDKLRQDIWAVADAVGFKSFHLVAHDHGAVLGWYAAGSAEGKQRLRSVSALSIPHTDAFSEGLSGDLEQQMASQYFSIFIMRDAAYLHGHLLYFLMGLPAGFRSAGSFQKALWWYNGAMEVGVMARPPTMSADFLKAHGYSALSWARWLFGGTPDGGDAQKVKTGEITMPALFVCGAKDPAVLCDRDFALKTKDYCTGGYHHLTVQCGHDLTEGCSEKDQVYGAIIDRITSADAKLTPARVV